jgi:hypothetical protein
LLYFAINQQLEMKPLRAGIIIDPRMNLVMFFWCGHFVSALGKQVRLNGVDSWQLRKKTGLV